jgi:hypothetical protein
MYKSFLNNMTKCIVLAGTFSAMAVAVSAKARSTGGSQMASAVIKILTDKPLKPSADPTKYNLSVAESFLKGRNHFSKLDSKSTGDVRAISLSVEANDTWEYGLNYLYSKSKFEMVEDNRVERSRSHDIVPHGIYFFGDSFLTVFGGGRFASTKISQNTGELAKGRAGVNTGILGAEIGIEKDFGLWSPSVNAGVLYENERTSKYRLSDGDVTPRQWLHFLQGSVSAQLAVNVHENFQPYIKTGYQSILRRSSGYTLQKWYGWLVGGGINLFSAEKWNTGLDYEYSKTPTGESQSSVMLKLAVSF